MPYTISLAPPAGRQLRKLDADSRERLRPAIDHLAHDPRPVGCKKLAGHEDLWRIRVGSFRIVYRVDDEVLAVMVLIIGHRRDVYEQVKRL